MSSLIGKQISELSNLLSAKEVSALEITRAHLEHLDKHDKETNAFLSRCDELALKQAQAVDDQIAAGVAPGPLAGIPTAIKDNICVAGYPTTCGSKILENFIAPYTAEAAQKLFDAGAIVIGKANLDEFAMGSSNENTSFAKARNPWNTDYVAGGSSGGPAVSVASGYSVIGIGSDTGGSVRLPASFCGVVGMKPTYGLISRFGLVAYASSLDQIGPFGRCVADTALALATMSGESEKDTTSLREPFKGTKYKAPDLEFAQSLKEDKIESYLSGLRVGVIADLMTDAIDSDVKDKVNSAARALESLGASVEEVNIPIISDALPVYYIVATAEASANLARFDGVRYGTRNMDAETITALYNMSRADGFGAEVKLRIMLGTYALSTGYYDAYYKKAQQVRRLIKESFDKTFESFDILLSPTGPSTAFKLGEKVDDPLKMYLSDIATLPANLAGLPAISVPFGFSSNNMPVGVQLMANQLSDSLLLSVAFALEKTDSGLNRKTPLLEAAK